MKLLLTLFFAALIIRAISKKQTKRVNMYMKVFKAIYRHRNSILADLRDSHSQEADLLRHEPLKNLHLNKV